MTPQYASARGDASASTSSAARSRTSTRTRSASALLARRPRRSAAGGGRRRGDQHLLRHERGGREEPQGGGARRADARPRLPDRLRARTSPADASPACPRTSPSSRSAAEETAAFVAGDVGAIGCVQADARLDRVRAFVKIQDGCSFSCGFCVIPLVRGASRSRSADAVLGEIRRRVDAGPPRGRAHRHQPRLLPRPRRRLRPAAPRPRGGGDARARAAAAQLDRDQPRRRRARRRAARDADRRAGTSTCRSSPATTACCGRCGRRYTTATYLRRLEPLAGEFNLTSDVIVGFPAEDEAAFARTLGRSSAPGITQGARLPVLAAARAPRRPPTTRCRRAVKKERGARLRALSRELCARRWQRQARLDGRRARRPARAAATATTTRRGSSMRRSASSSACAPRRSPRRGSLPSQRDDCLFCRLVREGDHVHRDDGFVAIDDINPQAPVHLLVIPEHHVDTFRDVGEFDAGGAEAHARVRRGDGPRRRARRTTGCVVERRPERGPDGLPPPLAHPRAASTTASDDGDEL